MPLQSTYAAASLRGFRSGRRNFPAMKIGGAASGTVTQNTHGYAITSPNGLGSGIYYLDAPVTTGKWYWEAVYNSGQLFIGITDDPTDVSHGNGGYNDGVNAGIQATSPNIFVSWVDGAWVGGSAGSFFAPLNSGDVIGFALNMVAATKTLSVYVNNSLIGAISWTDNTLTLRPMFFPYANTQVNVRSGCAFTPPAGYLYI